MTTIEERLREARRRTEETRIEKARAEEREIALTSQLSQIRDRMHEAGVSSVSEAKDKAAELRAQAEAALERAEKALEGETA